MENQRRAGNTSVASNYTGYYKDDHTVSGDVSFNGVTEINTEGKLSVVVHAEGVSADRAVVVSMRAHPSSAWVELASGTASNGVMTEICAQIVRGARIKINIDGAAKVAVGLKS